jgi:hypothetical protein
MASLGNPDTVTRMAVERVPGVRSWSFGSMFFCLQEPGEGRTAIREIAPHATVGAGFSLAGVGIRDFVFTADETPIISVDGFPPDLSLPLAEPNGFIVDAPCPAGQVGSRVIELIVGLEATSDDGGGWLGVDVSYSVGSTDYVLEIHNEMVICGPSVAEYCAAARSEAESR